MEDFENFEFEEIEQDEPEPVEPEPEQEEEKFIGSKKLKERFPREYAMAVQSDKDLIEFEHQLMLWRRDLRRLNPNQKAWEMDKRPHPLRQDIDQLLKAMQDPEHSMFDEASELRLIYLELRRDIGELYYNLLNTATLLSIVESKFDIMFIDQQ